MAKKIYSFTTIITIISILVVHSNISQAQRLDLFTSDSESMLYNGVVERVPYPKATGFYDFLPEGTPFDEIIRDTGVYYIYFKLPFEVEEIGVRLISPVPPYVFADTDDIETEEFSKAYGNDKSSHFDPNVLIEFGIVDGHKRFTPVAKIGENDNSDEVIAQPSGQFTNSLLRVTSEVLPSGVYRVRITKTNTEKPVHGSYLVHLGLIPGLRGIKISRKISELYTE